VAVDLSSNEGMCGSMATILEGANNLTGLDVSNEMMKEVSQFNELVTAIIALPNLTTLRMEGVLENRNAAGAKLGELSRCRKLRHLLCPNSFAREPTVSFLSKIVGNAQLSTLNISSNNLNPNDTVYITSLLVSNSAIKSLWCDGCNFGAGGWRSIMISLKMTRSLVEIGWPSKDILSCKPDDISELFSVLNRIQSLIKEQGICQRPGVGWTHPADSKPELDVAKLLNHPTKEESNSTGTPKRNRRGGLTNSSSSITPPSSPPTSTMTTTTTKTGAHIFRGETSNVLTSPTEAPPVAFNPFEVFGCRMVPHEGFVFALASGTLVSW